MGRLALLKHRPPPIGAVGGVPVNTVAPYFIANPLDPSTPVSSVIVGQRQFINPGTFTNSPTSYDWTVKDNVTGAVIDSGTSMLAAGDDFWRPTDDLATTVIRLEVIANNASGPSSAASMTKTVQAVVLSAAAPVINRTSSSGASPFTVNQAAFASAVFEGYAEQLVRATANDVELDTGEFIYANRVYDQTVYIDATTISAPNSLAWPSFDDSPYTQIYEQRRILAVTPAGQVILSPWSNMVKKSDALTNSTAYTKYRVHTTMTGSGFFTQIAEFKVAATPGGSDTANNTGVTISGTNPASTGPAANARDGSLSTYYACSFDGATPFPHDLILDYSGVGATAIAANEFKISAATGGGANGAPRNFTIDGWTGSAWVTLKSATAVIWADEETKTYVL